MGKTNDCSKVGAHCICQGIENARKWGVNVLKWLLNVSDYWVNCFYFNEHGIFTFISTDC
jgi:hypothetical protein